MVKACRCILEIRKSLCYTKQNIPTITPPTYLSRPHLHHPSPTLLAVPPTLRLLRNTHTTPMEPLIRTVRIIASNHTPITDPMTRAVFPIIPSVLILFFAFSFNFPLATFAGSCGSGVVHVFVFVVGAGTSGCGGGGWDLAGLRRVFGAGIIDFAEEAFVVCRVGC